MKATLSRFAASIAELGINREITKAKKIIVAFSGGADSALLLRLTAEYFIPRNVTVEAAHLNHMIRGEEALRDENFCINAAKKTHIALRLKRVDIPSLVKDGGSIEEVARRERYAFFEELLKENEDNGTDTVIFTAHNADDNLETVIFNMMRGSALRGMCGIPPVRDGKYFRPLLTFGGDEIRSLCERHGIEYVNDSTNFTTDYTRNYIRHRITPLLSELSGDPARSVFKMTQSLRADREYLDLVAERFLASHAHGVKREELSSLHEAVASRVIVLMHRKASENVKDVPSLERVHIAKILDLLQNSQSFNVSVPGNVRFSCEDGVCSFSPDRRDVCDIDASESKLKIGDLLVKNGYKLFVCTDLGELHKLKNENIYNLSIYKVLNFDKIKGSLRVRTRREGDVFYFGGMTRKVKRLFADKKLPHSVRRSLPIFADDAGIVWIPGFPVRDDLKCEPNEKCSYLVCLSEKEYN